MRVIGWRKNWVLILCCAIVLRNSFKINDLREIYSVEINLIFFSEDFFLSCASAILKHSHITSIIIQHSFYWEKHGAAIICKLQFNFHDSLANNNKWWRRQFCSIHKSHHPEKKSIFTMTEKLPMLLSKSDFMPCVSLRSASYVTQLHDFFLPRHLCQFTFSLQPLAYIDIFGALLWLFIFLLDHVVAFFCHSSCPN